jgi:hypothetical protein
MKTLFLLLALLTTNSILYAQFNRHYQDTSGLNLRIQQDLKRSAFRQPKVLTWQRTIAAPLILTSVGLYSITDNEFLNREEVKEERDEYIPKFHHRADDYLQFAPIAAVYGLNAMGIKGKTDFANRTAIMIKAEIILTAITFPLKKLTAVPRPDSGQPTSFPSGHTAQAFAAATFMSKEYGHKSIWYSIGAYSVASSVGIMRVMNNRHWISDVLVGAGVGIFSTNLAYLTHQYKWGKKKKGASTMILPSYDGRTAMVRVLFIGFD